MTDESTPNSAAVVGGGAVGLTAATALGDRGVAVTLYERDELGSGATGRAAGLCYDAYADRTDAQTAARSLDAFRELGVLSDCPYLWVAHAGDAHVAATIREQVEQMRDRGRDVALLEPSAIASAFPAVEPDHLELGAVAHNAGFVETTAYIQAMEERAADAGVAIETQTPVSLATETTIETPRSKREFDAVLLAAGAYTDELAAEAGHALAVGRYRAQALTATGVPETPPLFYDASERFYCRPHQDGLLVGDGAHAYDGDPRDADRTADEEFLHYARDRIERALGRSVTVERSWAGICTATPDRDPLLGRCADGLYVATGWHGHGFMRAPAIGETVATQMLGGAGIDHFGPTRFDGDEAIDLPAGIVD